MLSFLKYLLAVWLLPTLLLAQQRPDEPSRRTLATPLDITTPEARSRVGFLAEAYSYSQLFYDKFGIGGYFGAVTYRPVPFASVGLGYDYSVYNHSILLDVRQEVSRMWVKPTLLAGLGYAVAGRRQTVTSSFGVGQELQSRPGLVYRVGAGVRAYFFEKSHVGINAGLFYKNEPGFRVNETKSGSLQVESYDNVGSLCLFLGISL